MILGDAAFMPMTDEPLCMTPVNEEIGSVVPNDDPGDGESDLADSGFRIPDPPLIKLKPFDVEVFNREYSRELERLEDKEGRETCFDSCLIYL
jgi:hypothetical protein